MGEMTGYQGMGSDEHYSIKDFVKGTIVTAAILATLYIGVGTDLRTTEEKLKGSTGISELNTIERVIWGANKKIEHNDPVGELGSAWYLMHGPS